MKYYYKKPRPAKLLHYQDSRRYGKSILRNSRNVDGPVIVFRSRDREMLLALSINGKYELLYTKYLSTYMGQIDVVDHYLNLPTGTNWLEKYEMLLQKICDRA